MTFARYAAAAAPLKDPLDEPDDVAVVVLAMLLIKRQGLQRRLIARHEQYRRLLVGKIDVLAPRAAGNDEGVERLPVETLIADQAVTAAFERGAHQTCALLQGQRALAGPQHLHEKGHGLVDGLTGGRIDILNHQRLMAVPVPVAKLLEQLAHHVVTVDEHRRRIAGAAVVRDETRQKAAAAVDAMGVVGWKSLRLHGPANPLALLFLGVVVLEI